MALNNSELKTILTEGGNRVAGIIFNNNFKIHIGYKSSHLKSVDDILYKTVGETDLIGFPSIGPGAKMMDSEEPTHITWHLTELIESIIIMEPKFENYRLDPFVFN